MRGRPSPAAVTRAFFLRDARLDLATPVPFGLELLAAGFGLVTTWFLAKIVPPASVPGGYFSFVVTGLVTAALLSAAVLVTARNVREQQQRGTLEALLGSGAGSLSLALGLTAYPSVSAGYVVAIYAVVGSVFGLDLASPNWILAAIALALGAVAFAGLGVVGAALVIVVRRAAAAVGWIVAIAVFAGGQYFPVDVLPGWIRGLSLLSPFTWCLRIVRDALLEGATVREALPELTALAVSAASAWVVGAVALTWALRYARRTGSLAQY